MMGYRYLYMSIQFKHCKNNKHKRDVIEQYIDYKCKMFDAIDPTPPHRRPLTPFDENRNADRSPGPVLRGIIILFEQINFVDYIIY